MDQNYLKNQLEELSRNHRLLDIEIDTLSKMGTSDDLHIHRLKRARLVLKDQIRIIKSRLTPDIIA